MKLSRGRKTLGRIVPWTVTDMFCHGDIDVDGEQEIRLVKCELSILLQAMDEVEQSRAEELEISRLRWQLEVLLDAIGETEVQEDVILRSCELRDGEGKRGEAVR
jgi:hypothetical protein